MVEQYPPILGEDSAFLEAVEKCSRLAAIDRPCLVVGERGTGKELFAGRLHFLSQRWDGPFIKISCAALTETPLESELFGHEAGAFTGAQKRRAGRFELADGGTLFLDEIASASPAVQEKMLRVIEYGELERVGGTTTLRVDVRVVAAANMDLPSLAAAGEFRADLLDRLAFNVITIPPLRLRPADILTMAESFAIEASREFGFDAFPGFSPAAEQKLASHLWPGNVRELRNVVERSLCIHGDKASSIGRIDIDPFDSPWRPLGVDVNSKESGDSDRQTAVPTASSSFAETVAAFERSLLEKALSKSRYVQKEAAGRLDLSYHQFRRLLMKHGLLTRS